MGDREKYPRPSVTADAVVFAVESGVPLVLLIRREREPFQGRWAIPGGFCEPSESVEQAAARELEEETRLNGVALEQLHTYSAPGRDPRGWVISVAHVGTIPAARMAEAKGGDDASETRWWRVSERADGGLSLSSGGETAGPLAFDHDDVLRAALAWFRARAAP